MPSKAGYHSLDLVQGEWLDGYGSKYEVSLDEPHRESCTVATSRPDAKKIVTKGLLRQSRDGTEITWGKNYILDAQYSSDSFIKWLPYSGGKEYCWQRVPKWEHKTCDATRHDELLAEQLSRGIPLADDDGSPLLKASRDAIFQRSYADAATSQKAERWADSVPEASLPEASLPSAIRSRDAPKYVPPPVPTTSLPSSEIRNSDAPKHAPPQVPTTGMPSSAIRSSLRDAPKYAPPPVPTMRQPSSAIRSGDGPRPAPPPVEGLEMHLCIFHGDSYGFKQFKSKRETHRQCLEALLGFVSKSLVTDIQLSGKVVSSFFVGSDILHMRGANTVDMKDLLGSSCGIDRPGLTWELDPAQRDVKSKRRVLLERFADVLRRAPEDSIALVVSSETTDTDTNYEDLKEIGRNKVPQSARVYVLLAGADGFDGNEDSDQAFVKAIVAMCTLHLGINRVLQVNLSNDSAVNATLSSTQFANLGTTYPSTSARLAAFLSTELRQGLLDNAVAGAEKWHSVSEVATECSGTLLQLCQELSRHDNGGPGAKPMMWTDKGLVSATENMKDVFPSGPDMKEGRKIKVAVDSCYACKKESILECPVCSNWCCQDHWHTATEPQRCEGCWHLHCYACHAFAMEVRGRKLHVCDCTRRACQTHFNTYAKRCNLCQARSGGQGGKGGRQASQMLPVPPPPSTPPPPVSKTGVQEGFKAPQTHVDDSGRRTNGSKTDEKRLPPKLRNKPLKLPPDDDDDLAASSSFSPGGSQSDEVVREPVQVDLKGMRLPKAKAKAEEPGSRNGKNGTTRTEPTAAPCKELASELVQRKGAYTKVEFVAANNKDRVFSWADAFDEENHSDAESDHDAKASGITYLKKGAKAQAKGKSQALKKHKGKTQQEIDDEALLDELSRRRWLSPPNVVFAVIVAFMLGYCGLNYDEVSETFLKMVDDSTKAFLKACCA